MSHEIAKQVQYFYVVFHFTQYFQYCYKVFVFCVVCCVCYCVFVYVIYICIWLFVLLWQKNFPLGTNKVYLVLHPPPGETRHFTVCCLLLTWPQCIVVYAVLICDHLLFTSFRTALWDTLSGYLDGRWMIIKDWKATTKWNIHYIVRRERLQTQPLSFCFIAFTMFPVPMVLVDHISGIPLCIMVPDYSLVCRYVQYDKA